MSRIVFAWEMGNNHGHLWRLLPIALRLQAQGHEVSFVLKPMVSAQRYLAPHGIRWYPCPTLLAPIDLGREITTYADILAAQGASSPDLLRGIVHAWENLFSLLQADIIVIEHAPFALLAAKRAGIRTVQVGTGFTIPPTLSPAPCFRPSGRFRSEPVSPFRPRCLRRHVSGPGPRRQWKPASGRRSRSSVPSSRYSIANKV
jgi:hypothetical protein